MSPEDVSDTFGESHHCKNKKFEHFGKSQLKTVSPGLIWVIMSCKDLCSDARVRTGYIKCVFRDLGLQSEGYSDISSLSCVVFAYK